MICPKCGRRTYKDEIICPKCGANMTSRQYRSSSTPTIQVKKTYPSATADTLSSKSEPAAFTSFEPVKDNPPEPHSEPYYAPSPMPVSPSHKKAPSPPPEPISEPIPEPIPETSQKEDLDRTLTFAAIKEASSVETAAVREYNRMKAQLRESKAYDDASKVVLDRLPEGYVYVKMSIDEADKLSNRKTIPKPLLFGIMGAAAITIILIIILFAITGTKPTPLITGKWQGEIEPLRFGITGIPFTKVDTVWEFEKNGNVTITPQDSLLSGYVLSGKYELSENDTAHLDLNFEGQSIEVDIIYSVNKADKTMIISNRASPSYTYSFKKLN